MKFFSIFFINAAVFLLLLFTINLISAAYLDVNDKYPVYVQKLKKLAGAEDGFNLFKRGVGMDLPNYPKDPIIRRMFNEQAEVTQHFRYRSYVGWVLDAFKGKTLTIGENGYRQHKPTTDRPAGTVYFFGGSTMWGTGSPDAGTIPAQFNQFFPEYAVHNISVSGYTSRTELAALTNLLNQGTVPDLAIFFDGVNDVPTLCRPEHHLNANAQEWNIRQKLDRAPSLMLERLGAIFFRSTIELVSRWIAPRSGVGSRCLNDPSYARRVAETMVANWSLVHELMTRRGKKFVAVLQPVAFVGSPRMDHLPSDLENVVGKDYRVIYPLVLQIAKERGLDFFYDATGAYDGGVHYYIDFAHVSPNGNFVIASMLAERVKRFLSGYRQFDGKISYSNFP